MNSPENQSPASSTNEPGQDESNADSPRKKIAIGSQRDVASIELAPSKPTVVERAEKNRIELNSSMAEPKLAAPPAPEVRSAVGLSDDIESEIENALSGLSMDDVVEKAALQPAEPEEGERLKATVTRVDAENVLVTLKGRFEGIIPKRQFKELPAPGSLVEVVVHSQNEEDGLYELGMPGVAADAGDWETIKRDDVVEARVTGANTGGLEVAVGNLRGFIPASQIERFRVEQFGEYVNQKFVCLVAEVNAGRKKLVLSRRAILDREYEETRRKMMETLQPGVELEGIVTRLLDFGAFVDIGGVEGLAHISKLSWSRIKHPSEVVKEGQRVKVKIESIDKEAGRISLSHRDTLEHPWEHAAEKFGEGTLVKGIVSRLAQFGAFVKLDHGIEGLIHVSELAHHRVIAVKNIVKVGDEVEVKVLSLDVEGQKIGLSLKATQTPPERPSDKKKDEEIDEAPRELAVKGSGEPLQGGKTRKSGGEQFGLRL